MPKHVFECITLVACALSFEASMARATPLPTVTITSATGYVSFGDFAGACDGVCAFLSSPKFTLQYSGAFIPAPYFGVTPGSSLENFYLAEAVGVPTNPTGSLVFNGTSYPVAYPDGGVTVTTTSPVVVPSGNATIEVPATLAGRGLACTAIYEEVPDILGCFPDPAVVHPYPVQIALVDLDLSGFMTFRFQPDSLPGEVVYSATFTPVPEPAMPLLLIPVLGAAAAWSWRKGGSKRKGLKGLRPSAHEW